MSEQDEFKVEAYGTVTPPPETEADGDETGEEPDTDEETD